MIRVCLVDDQTLVRQGIRSLLALDDGIEVVAEAADGRQAVELIPQIRPDVVLMDMRMPVMSGLEALQALARTNNLPPTIILTTFDDDQLVLAGLKAGAKGYLLKDVTPGDLVACVRTVHGGGTWVSPVVASKLVGRMTRVQVTPQEMRVLRQVAEGKSNREIGETLFISEATVKIHLSHLFEKLGASSRTDAVARAVERGLIRMR